jgi:hypothetical protein
MRDEISETRGASSMKTFVAVLALSAAAALAQSGPPVPMGTGPGVHSPNSPFPPLPERSDVVAWSVLSGVKTRAQNNRLLPAFEKPQLALHEKTQRIQGFMMPLEPGEKHSHFLLSSVPLTCAFCVPGGPESMVEVKTRTPVKYTLDPVTVEGRFAVLSDDPYGLYYRVTDAVGVK